MSIDLFSFAARYNEIVRSEKNEITLASLDTKPLGQGATAWWTPVLSVDTNIIVVGQHFRHSAHLRGEYQIKIILGNVKIHNVASFALKNLNACNAAFVWNKY